MTALLFVSFADHFSVTVVAEMFLYKMRLAVYVTGNIKFGHPFPTRRAIHIFYTILL